MGMNETFMFKGKKYRSGDRVRASVGGFELKGDVFIYIAVPAENVAFDNASDIWGRHNFDKEIIFYICHNNKMPYGYRSPNMLGCSTSWFSSIKLNDKGNWETTESVNLIDNIGSGRVDQLSRIVDLAFQKGM